MKYRKSNNGKMVDRGCRNNGPCTHCTASRLHSAHKAEQAALDQLMDYADQYRSHRKCEPGSCELHPNDH
jgi:hypothetical protein